jgi:glycosyltransferase involved in cell wall biosynthesis
VDALRRFERRIVMSADFANDVRVVAYYRLPGPRRDSRSGEDLREWAVVRAVRPCFSGHDQPQVPGELGYCDVRDPAVRDAQATLARAHGVSAFCYMFRWPLDGSLDPTLAEIVANGQPDFPFCLCWETVTGHAGAGFGTKDMESAMRYSPDQSVAVMRALLPAFANPRYLRIRGRPLFVMSSPDPIVEVRAVAARWREECIHAGAGDPLLACYGGAMGASPDEIGFDAIIETPPLGGFPEGRREQIGAVTPGFEGDVRNYRSYVAQMLTAPRPDHLMFRCVMPGWDATAREDDATRMFVNANPETFGFWAERAVDFTRLRFSPDDRLLFVRSWNEWDAACHLEPDARHGRANLQALERAVCGPPRLRPDRPALRAIEAWAGAGGGLAAARVVRSAAESPRAISGPRVSVVMPAYNHERYVAAALDSVVAQTHANLEIIVVDDGSSDSTGAILDDYAGRCRTHPITVVHQPNAGAHDAFNHGLALARGDIVALMNSDDLYAPDRIERMIAQLDSRGAGLGFSSTRFIDDEGRDVDNTDPYAKQLRRAIDEAIKAPDPLYVLVYNNIAISTGNFVFRRALLERVGGFCAMQVCHDWDFLLASSYVAPLTLVAAPLYFYRLHGSNTFARARIQAAFELEQLLSGFFADIDSHPLLEDPQRAAHFRDYVRSIGLGGYLG